MKIKGIDISYCQRNIDYKKLKAAGIEFAIIRTGYKEKTDDMLAKHVEGCTEAGIKYGFYVYALSSTVDEAIKEARHCLKSIENYSPEYPIFYDLEDDRLTPLKPTLTTDIALAFLAEIKKANYYAAIYANPAWLETYLEKTRLSAYDIWLAAWTENPDKPTKYDYNQTMWQWGLDNIDGTGAVDGNICYMDYPSVINRGGFNKPVQNSDNSNNVIVDNSTKDFISFTDTDKYYKCIGKAVNLRKYPSTGAAVLGVLEKGAVYHALSELYTGENLKWLGINGGFSMYVDQIGDTLFEKTNKPDLPLKVGDLVTITKPYASASTSASAANRAAIGGKRYIVRKITGANFPYQLGTKKEIITSDNTTGFASADGLEKT